MKRNSIRSSLLLLLVAVVWGIAFVAQSVGTGYISAFTFNCMRCLLGALVLLPVIFWTGRTKREDRESIRTGRAKREDPESVRTGRTKREDQESIRTGRAQRNGRDPEQAGWSRLTLIGGLYSGAALFVASNLQQLGIQYTTVGKAGFITAMYIVLVPVLGIFRKKRVGIKVWIGVALAVAGLYLLCMTEKFSIGKGDVLVLLCALCFSIQILIVDYYAPRVDGVRMACIQFFICGLLSGAGMLLFEKLSLSAIRQAAIPIGYAGIFSCGVGYTLQIVGQKEMDPTVASLILSLESVVSVLAGWLLLGQKLSVRELGGCVLMFAAIILAQLPDKARMGSTESGF